LDEMADEAMPEMFQVYPQRDMPGLWYSDQESSPAKVFAGRQVRPTKNGRVQRTLRNLESALT
jgi:hypothetical protein